MKLRALNKPLHFSSMNPDIYETGYNFQGGMKDAPTYLGAICEFTGVQRTLTCVHA